MNPLILYRTVARAQQLEAEERNSVPRTTAQFPGFTDDPEEQQATTTSIRDDEIDFVNPQDTKGAYQDEFSEDEDDVFRYGDGNDGQSAISLHRQSSHR